MPPASIKGAIKRSSSKLGAGKGSLAHIGSTPTKFRIDFFVQYVDGVCCDDGVCVVYERRDTALVTKAVMAKDGKAVFRENMALQVTLFRRADGGGGPPSLMRRRPNSPSRKMMRTARRWPRCTSTSPTMCTARRARLLLTSSCPTG
eukprot:TRINITY_DN4355_c0_g1_i3.p5 TRINITY_DN4355_c0_g1~~TRINITY_DN4355_c0_g1_i3.p5  ORF type:complete len:147 (-),score=38.89 TRINITY_DN4355_c0_g1_i3:832-1272(-)